MFKIQKSKIIFLSIIFLSLFGLAKNSEAATYTVCSSGCDYTSIGTVFSSRDLEPDDIVEVRADTQGGTTIFNVASAISPGANDSGSSSHPVTLKAREGDTVIIDGGGNAIYGINLNNSSLNYFTVDGFIIQNFGMSHIIMGTASTQNGMVVKNCTININPALATTQSIHGIIVSGNGTIIENNTITQGEASSGTQQADAITGGNSAVFINSPIIRNNVITIRNTAATPHVDGIQLSNAKNAQIYGNIISLPLAYNYRQGIYMEFYNLVADPEIPEDFGTAYVYNNLIYGYGGSYLLQFETRHSAPATQDATVEIHVLNNTIDAFNIATSLPFRTTGPNIYFQNNIIFVRRSASPAAFFVSDDPQIPSRIKNNVYYVENPAGSVALIDGVSYSSWANWRTAGYDTDGFYANPLLDSNYHFLSATSPGVNTGTDLSSIFTRDISGISRPQGSAWDIGAYEYVSGGGGTTAPAAPSGLSVQ